MGPTSASEFYSLIQKDGSPENYTKWANRFEEFVKSMNYTGYKSVCSKWETYHREVGLESDSTCSKHRIFDAGCGTGLVGENLLSLVPRNAVEMYGGDFSPDMLKEARAKHVYTDLQVVNLKEKLPYEADFFDSIVCSAVFTLGHCGPESIPNLIRVLKKGCYMIATVKTLIYGDEMKIEWEKNIMDCNCELIEDNEMPYRDSGEAVVVVIRKK